jgi:hypothetical protein
VKNALILFKDERFLQFGLFESSDGFEGFLVSIPLISVYGIVYSIFWD